MNKAASGVLVTLLPCLLLTEANALAEGASGRTGGATRATALLQRLSKVEGRAAGEAMSRSGAKSPGARIAAATAYKMLAEPGPQMLTKLPASPLAVQKGPSGTTWRIGFARAGTTFSSRAVVNDANEKIGTDKASVTRIGKTTTSVRTISASEKGFIKVWDKTTVYSREKGALRGPDHFAERQGTYSHGGMLTTVNATVEAVKSPAGDHVKSSAWGAVESLGSTNAKADRGHAVVRLRATSQRVVPSP